MNGISANGKHSVTDFGNPYAWSSIGDPVKKIIRETVPYMSGYYDFSMLGGYVAYESREIAYAFDLIADTPAALHEGVAAFTRWLHGIHESDIHDDEIAGYHFRGTCDGCDVDWDESGMKATVEATFTCHPFRIANDESTASLVVGDNVVTITGQRVTPMAVSEGTSIIEVGGFTQTVTGSAWLETALETGSNVIKVTGDPCTITWREELI